MKSSSVLLILPLLLTAVVSERGMREELEVMKTSGCLPKDFNITDFEECKPKTIGSLEEIQCVAKSAGFVNGTGVDFEGAMDFIASLSEDEQWKMLASEQLAICPSMMSEDLAKDRQGAFLFSCFFMLMRFHCNGQRTAEFLQTIDNDNGETTGYKLAYFAEGYCITGRLKPKSMDVWNECATDNELDFSVLQEASKSYKMFISGSLNSDESPSEEDITLVGVQMDNFKATIYCSMRNTGEITEDGELDIDRARENLQETISEESACESGKEDYVKMAALAVLEHCKGNSSSTPSPDEFITCWFGSLPYSCTSMKAHALALSPANKRGGRRGNRGGRKQRRRNGGGKQRRRNGSGKQRRRNRNRNRQQQQDEVPQEAGR